MFGFHEISSRSESTYVRVNFIEQMGNKLYVGGIPWTSTNEELKEAFEKAGAVQSATILMDKVTGRSRGFGFVEMATTEEAQAALDMWNGQEFGGRVLKVDFAQPIKERD